jgi:hypothetical protein
LLTEYDNFRYTANVAYFIGIEQPTASKPFARIFNYESEPVLYFRHELATIRSLPPELRAAIQPSEVSPRYWSRMRVDAAPALASSLLRQSYDLVVASCSRKGQDLVHAVAAETNRFLEFHIAAIGLVDRSHTSLYYSGMPILSAKLGDVAKFSWNQLFVRFCTKESSTERWEMIGASRWQEWSAAMTAAVEDGNAPPLTYDRSPHELAKIAEADAKITDFRCSNCGQPCPSYRKTCKHCGKPVSTA